MRPIFLSPIFLSALSPSFFAFYVSFRGHFLLPLSVLIREAHEWASLVLF